MSRFPVVRSKASLLLAMLLAGFGCGPTPENIPVVYGSWEPNEVKSCYAVTQDSPDGGSNRIFKLLICDPRLHIIWVLDKDVGAKNAVARNSKQFPVRFLEQKSALVVNGDDYGTPWECKKTADGFDCK